MRWRASPAPAAARRTPAAEGFRFLGAAARLGAALACAVCLAGCGLVEDVIGSRQIANPLGLDGVELALRSEIVAASVPAERPHALAPQQGRTFGADLGPVPVSDVDVSGIPGWFDPDALTVDVRLRSTVTIASHVALDGAAFAQTLSFYRARLVGLSLVDGSGAPRVDIPLIATPAEAALGLAKAECAGVAPVVCTYTAQSGTSDFVIPFSVHGAAMDDLYAIISRGAPTNEAGGRFELDVMGTLPEDAVVTVTIDAPSGTLDP